MRMEDRRRTCNGTCWHAGRRRSQLEAIGRSIRLRVTASPLLALTGGHSKMHLFLVIQRETRRETRRMKRTIASAAAILLASAAGAFADCGDDALNASWEYFVLESDRSPGSASAEVCTIRINPDKIISSVRCRAPSDSPDLVEEELLNVRVIKANCRFQFRDAAGNCRYYGALTSDELSGSGVALCSNGARYQFFLIKR
jgi:hypothetical protein